MLAFGTWQLSILCDTKTFCPPSKQEGIEVMRVNHEGEDHLKGSEKNTTVLFLC